MKNIPRVTLVLTNGLGDGLRDYVDKEVKNTEGANVLFVRKKIERKGEQMNPDEPVEYKEKSLDESGNKIDPNSMLISQEQIEALRNEIPEVKTITRRYWVKGEYITISGAKKYRVFLDMLSEGVTQKVEAGKTIDGANQIMLPLDIAKAYDENLNNLIGKTATVAYKVKDQDDEIKTLQLKIVGVTTKGMMTSFSSYIDSETAKRIYEDQNQQADDLNQFSNLTLQLKTGEPQKIAAVKDKLDELGFSADSIADRQKRAYDGVAILQIGLNLFAFIALLAASFGIINTLVIAVLERTKEIGLQKALGMGRGKIFLLFSFESILIGFWGAVIGVLGGIIVGTIVNIFVARTYLESFEGYSIFVFKPLSIFLVMLLVCTIAFAAGVFPAFRASRLNPIEALRYE
jgi:putative ABC transport system permease protein